MVNRVGEFVLVFAPGDPDFQAISPNILAAIGDALARVFNSSEVALGNPSDLDAIAVYLIGTPETGSIRVPLLAAGVSSLAIAANFSQVTGFDVKLAIEAMRSHLQSHAREPHPTAPGTPIYIIVQNGGFRSSMQSLGDAVKESGCPSITIVAAGIEPVELVQSGANNPTIPIEDYRSEVAKLGKELAALRESERSLRARWIEEGANSPITPEIERSLDQVLMHIHDAEDELKRQEQGLPPRSGGDER